MEPNLFFWTAALLDLGIVVASAALGVRRIRAGDVRGHRRAMLTSVALVALFLLSYLAKLLLLGREDRGAWTAWDHRVLYTHETFVAVMLLGGATALFRASRFRSSLPADGRLAPGERRARERAGHRRAGWAAVGAAALAFATAALVLIGMYDRATG